MNLAVLLTLRKTWRSFSASALFVNCKNNKSPSKNVQNLQSSNKKCSYAYDIFTAPGDALVTAKRCPGANLGRS